MTSGFTVLSYYQLLKILAQTWHNVFQLKLSYLKVIFLLEMCWLCKNKTTGCYCNENWDFTWENPNIFHKDYYSLRGQGERS